MSSQVFAARAGRGALVADALTGAWRTPPPASSLSRDGLAEIHPLLLAGGVGALAWRCLVQASDDGLRESEEALALRQAYRLHALQGALRMKQIGDAVSRLRAGGVEPLLAKGFAAARHYPEPGLRPYGDIDLYVPPARREAAWQALVRADGDPLPVDLHAGCPDLEERRMEELYARSTRVKVGGVEVRLMGPEDHLHLLCAHALRHGMSRPLWLCDIGAAVETCPPSFDWEYFFGRNTQRSAWLRCALELSRRLLGASLERVPPPDVPRALPGWVERSVRDQWGRGLGALRPMTSVLGAAHGRFSWLQILRETRRHWPNPIEATVGVGGALTGAPRWPYQLAHTLSRSTRLAARWARRDRETREPRRFA